MMVESEEEMTDKEYAEIQKHVKIEDNYMRMVENLDDCLNSCPKGLENTFRKCLQDVYKYPWHGWTDECQVCGCFYNDDCEACIERILK